MGVWLCSGDTGGDWLCLGKRDEDPGERVRGDKLCRDLSEACERQVLSPLYMNHILQYIRTLAQSMIYRTTHCTQLFLGLYISCLLVNSRAYMQLAN